MSERVLYSTAGQLQAIGSQPHAVLGAFGDGSVIAAGDDAAVALMARSAPLRLLFFAREAYEQAVRGLTARDAEAAVHKRLATWTPNAAYEGMDWLYRTQRRCLALTALAMQTPQRATVPGDHFEHSIGALHRLVNEGAYGGSTLIAVLVYVLEREAMLLAELHPQQAAAEIDQRKRFSTGVVQALGALGRPEFQRHPPYVEAQRAAWVSPADASLRAAIKAGVRPAVDWRGGLVSTFGSRELESMMQQGKNLRILYLRANEFIQDFTELTPAQLLRDLEERLQADPGAAWEDYLNFLRLETALMRRAAIDKARAEKSAVTAELAVPLQSEGALLLAALARRPSWTDARTRAQPNALVQAETQVVGDATFLARMSTAPAHDDVHRRYRSFAEFKARQRQRF